MADTPEIKQEKQTTTAVEKTNEKLDKLDETITKQLSGVVDAVNKPPKKDVEGIQETKRTNKNMLDVLKGIKATFDKSLVGKGAGGLVAGVKKLFKFLIKNFMKLVTIGMIGLLATLDMKQLKELWLAFSDAIKAMAKTLKPIILGIAKWAKDTALPATFEALKRQLKLFTKMWTDIGTHLEGWGDKTFDEKFESILGVMDTIGDYFWETGKNLLDWAGNLLGVKGSLSKKIISSFDWISGDDDGGEGGKGSNFLSNLGSIVRGFVGMFIVGKVLPLGWFSTVLMAPLKLALGIGKTGAGFMWELGKGLVKAMPAMGKGSKFALKLLGSHAGKIGLLGLAFAVGKGIYEGYEAVNAGASIREGYNIGLASFINTLTLNMLPEGMALGWAKSINNFFGDVYDAMFGEKEKKRTADEIRKERELRSGKEFLDLSPEEKKAKLAELRKKQEEDRLGGKGSVLALKKGDIKALTSEQTRINNKMKGMAAVLQGQKVQDWSEWYKLQAQSKAIQGELVALAGPSDKAASIISAPVKIKKGTVDWGFISKKEGGSKLEGYVPNPEGSKSGITIATGFDLGARNKKDLAGLSPGLQKKLAPYLGFKGKDAARLLGMAPLTITAKEAKEIDAMSKGSSMAKLKSEWNKRALEIHGQFFSDLTSGQKTIAASVAFQYGSLSKVPKFRNAMQTGDWEGAAGELENFGDAYGTRRESEASYLRNDTGVQLAMLQKQGQLQGAMGGGADGGSTTTIIGGDSPTTNVGLKGNTRDPFVAESKV